MAVMKKKPKPLRPDPTKANYKGTTGKNPVVKITKVTKPLRKPTVKNPTAPTGMGSAAPRGSVRVITSSETGMKKGKAGRNRSGAPMSKDYKARKGNQKLIESTQQIAKKGYIGLTAEEKKALSAKGGKPSQGVQPKKKTPPAPKPKGRPGLRGGFGGGGGLFGGRGLSGTR